MGSLRAWAHGPLTRQQPAVFNIIALAYSYNKSRSGHLDIPLVCAYRRLAHAEPFAEFILGSTASDEFKPFSDGHRLPAVSSANRNGTLIQRMDHGLRRLLKPNRYFYIDYGYYKS